MINCFNELWNMIRKPASWKIKLKAVNKRRDILFCCQRAEIFDILSKVWQNYEAKAESTTDINDKMEQM